MEMYTRIRDSTIRTLAQDQFGEKSHPFGKVVWVPSFYTTRATFPCIFISKEAKRFIFHSPKFR